MTGVALTAIRGDNPMGFLAALGALSLATDVLGRGAALRWEPSGPSWTPMLDGPGVATEDDIIELIETAHERRDLESELGWSADLMKLDRQTVRSLLEERLRADRRREAEFVAACVAELPPRRNSPDLVRYTPFRMIPRVGRSRFLAAALAESRAGTARLRDCLFGSWTYSKGVNALRWDPGARIQARALMAEAPSIAGTLGVSCATLLAVRGLGFFPLVTTSRDAVPPGLTRKNRLIWPVWKDGLSEAAVRVLLAARWLHGSDEESERHLEAHGVTTRYVAPRVRLGDDQELLGWGEPILPSDEDGR